MRFLPSQVTQSTTARRLLGENRLASHLAKQRRSNADRAAASSRSQLSRREPEQVLAKPLHSGMDVARLALGEPATPPLATIVHQRLCYGHRDGDIAAFNALGANDSARISAWVTEQLAADASDPAPGKEAAWGFSTLGKSAFDLWNDHHRNPDWQVFIRPVNELERRTICRATFSTRQLQEVIFEFWHNHFSIFAEDEGPMMVLFDREVIRTHGLGNFRALLGASVKSWAMLDYLDNKYNSYAPWEENDGINENFARELLELHTLGDENYFPGMTPDQVPDGPGGIKVGYTDTDVSQAARCLTGWTTEDAYIWEGIWPPFQYAFSFYPEWHDDQNIKTVLGQEIDNLSDSDGGTVQDGDDLLDLLAGHRGTAVFICRKLCRRLVADDPSESLVQSAADVFQNNLASSDQIAKVVRHIVESADFAGTFGEKIKRPYEIIIGQMRALDFDFPLAHGEDFQSDRAGWFMWQLYLTGHLPFGWGPPNGYPDVRAAWGGSSPRVMTWWFSNFLCNVQNQDVGGEPTRYIEIEALTGDLSAMTPTQIVDHWIDRLCARTIPAGERAEFISFMADGADANVVLDPSRLDQDYEAPAQVRTLVALIAMSPSFLWR